MLHFDLVQAADPGAEDHPAAGGIFAGEIQARIPDGVDAGDQGELREPIQPLHLTGLDVALGGPVDDFPSELHAEARRVETLDPADAALAVAQADPEILDLAAQRGDCAEAGDGDAVFHGSSSGVGSCLPLPSTALWMWSIA